MKPRAGYIKEDGAKTPQLWHRASSNTDWSCPCSLSCSLLRQPGTELRAWPLGVKAGIEGSKELPVHRTKKQPLFPHGQHNTPGQVCRAAGYQVR